jgi:hypothetical protein
MSDHVICHMATFLSPAPRMHATPLRLSKGPARAGPLLGTTSNPNSFAHARAKNLIRNDALNGQSPGRYGAYVPPSVLAAIPTDICFSAARARRRSVPLRTAAVSRAISRCSGPAEAEGRSGIDIRAGYRSARRARPRRGGYPLACQSAAPGGGGRRCRPFTVWFAAHPPRAATVAVLRHIGCFAALVSCAGSSSF